MINVKKHAMIRYCERVMGLTEKHEINQYISLNAEQITTWINRMNDNAQFIYRGQIGDNITRIFKMADNVVLVVDTGNSCVVTLYKCLFDFGDEMDKKIIQSELKNIKELNETLDVINKGIEEFVEQKKLEENILEGQIKAMEDQLRILKNNKSFIGDEITNKRTSRDFTTKELEKRAIRICNSLDYRRDQSEKAI